MREGGTAIEAASTEMTEACHGGMPDVMISIAHHAETEICLKVEWIEEWVVVTGGHQDLTVLIVVIAMSSLNR